MKTPWHLLGKIISVVDNGEFLINSKCVGFVYNPYERKDYGILKWLDGEFEQWKKIMDEYEL